jgi:hypothetical protein
LFLGDVPRGDKACRKVDEGSVHLLLAHNSLPDSGRYIHSAPYQFIQCGCFVHGFDDVPFQEINMPVIQLKKMLLHHRGIPSRILAISPAIRESTKCGFHHFSRVSGIFSSCASVCARVSSE